METINSDIKVTKAEIDKFVKKTSMSRKRAETEIRIRKAKKRIREMRKRMKMVPSRPSGWGW
jgi:division protein CdvB (Snf7/Vps24/ESCRT-III family)